MAQQKTSQVEALLPVKVGPGNVHFAQGMKAGRWVFATGLLGQDFVNGIAPDVLADRAPNSGLPKREKEAQRIFENLDAVLRAAGTERGNLVRTDQYYTTHKAVPAYQSVRRAFLDGRIPPSTSITEQRLLLPDADITIQAIAVVAEKGFTPEHLRHEHLKGRPTSGYSPALTVGDYIFVPGITAMVIGDEPHRNGVAAGALMAEGAQWGGQPTKIEAEFIINQRIVPSLALAGATLKDIVHAQCYLSTTEDFAEFNEAWVRYFGPSGPAFSLIPCARHGLAPHDGTIEINVLAVKPDGAVKKQTIDAGVPMALRQQPQAVRAGDLLFMCGLMAVDKDGLIEAARPNKRMPHHASRAQAQAECIIDNVERLCKAAGTSLANVVRVQQYHTDLADFYPVYKVWERRLGGQPLPFSAVEVPGPLPVPEATVLMDIWAYAP